MQGLALTTGIATTIMSFRPNSMSNLVHRLAFRTTKSYIVLYGKINHRFVNLSCTCDMTPGHRLLIFFSFKANLQIGSNFNRNNSVIFATLLYGLLC